MGTPTDALCVKCHEQTGGRPATFAQVDVSTHYITTCLACHNPHSGISKKPPVVMHPIDGIPACLTCHGTDAFKARDLRHPDASTDDQACLACHTLAKTTTTSVQP